MKKRVTIAEIAKRCNTSIGTVDRALNNRSGIHSETKDFILQTAKEMGYQTNPIAGALSRKKSIRLGIVYCENHADFYDYVNRGIEQAAKELLIYGVEVTKWKTKNLSWEEQLELLESIDLNSYDGFAINSAGMQTDAILNHIVDLGIPVLTFNTDAPATKRFCYIGANARQAGNLAGELIGKLMGQEGKVAALGSFLATNSFIERFIGFYEVIQREYPKITLCPFSECFNDTKSAYHETLRVLEKESDIKALYITGSAGTVGAIEAIKEIGRKDMILVGYDITEPTIQALKEGWCTAVLYQDPYFQGYHAVKVLAKHMLEGFVPRSPLLTVDTKIMMKYNLEECENTALFLS